MKTNIISILLIFISLNSFAQISFESGYFIDSNNQRFECLIKNIDWKNNPTEFEYKITADGKIERGSLETAKEFGITGFSRYVMAETKIDLSSTDVNSLSKTRDPEWSQQKLFLKVIVEGKATLYYYEKKGLIRFFYSVADSAIKQLIYKEYIVQENQVACNYKFREQLWLDVRCVNSKTSDLEQIKYSKNDLERYFKKYNESYSIATLSYGKKAGKNSYHFRICPGLNYSSVKLHDLSFPGSTVDFGNQINFCIGLDAEIILPFNKNKWGVVFTPSYQYFNATADYDNTPIAVNIDYQSIEFPIGLRHKFFMPENLIIFVDALFITNYSFDLNSTISNLDVRTENSYAIGGGAEFKKISAEIRYSTHRNLLRDYINWNTDYHRISLILGFKIL
jgi:hypothetical protein